MTFPFHLPALGRPENRLSHGETAAHRRVLSNFSRRPLILISMVSILLASLGFPKSHAQDNSFDDFLKRSEERQKNLNRSEEQQRNLNNESSPLLSIKERPTIIVPRLENVASLEWWNTKVSTLLTTVVINKLSQSRNIRIARQSDDFTLDQDSSQLANYVVIGRINSLEENKEVSTGAVLAFGVFGLLAPKNTVRLDLEIKILDTVSGNVNDSIIISGLSNEIKPKDIDPIIKDLAKETDNTIKLPIQKAIQSAINKTTYYVENWIVSQHS